MGVSDDLRKIRIRRTVREVAPIESIDESRFFRKAPSLNSLDVIKDPLLLAHALLGLDGEHTEDPYPTAPRTSELHKVCIREKLLGLRHASLTRRHVDLQQKVTFDIGNAVHKWLQNDSAYLGTKLVGWWECLACGMKRFGRYCKDRCPRCNARSEAFEYHEHSFNLVEPYRVTGHPDLFLEFGPGDIRVGELKTINGKDYERLVTPLSDHVIQLTSYMILSQYDTTLPVRLNSHRGVIMYICKKHLTKAFPVKAFHVERRPEVERVIVTLLSDFKKGFDDPDYLPEPIAECTNHGFTNYRAKRCPVFHLCNRMHTDT